MDLTKQQLNILRDLTDLRSSVENTLELMEARTNLFLHTLPPLHVPDVSPNWFNTPVDEALIAFELNCFSVAVARKLAAMLELERADQFDATSIPKIDSGINDNVMFTWNYDDVAYSWLIEPAVLGIPNVKITQVEVRPLKPAKSTFIFDFYTARAKFKEIINGK
jgi:hypothetical protein